MRHTAVLFGAAACGATNAADYKEADAATHFAAFKRDHARVYASAGEESHRFGVFKETMRLAVEEQKLNPDAVFGVNLFADLSAKEFKAYHNLVWPSNRTYDQVAPQFSDAEVAEALATSVDWTTKGAVTPVKDQAQCGSCWAFATIANIEGRWALAGNKLTSLSEQQLTSCDKLDNGCGGGLPENAYKWLIKSSKGQVDTEASYPYKSGGGSSGTCKKSGTVVGATITGSETIKGSEGQLATYVKTNGPVAIGVDASKFQSYKSGVMTNCGGRSLDHGVTIVGYESGSYWKIKNSWGKSYGEGGYIRIKRGNNCCGMNNDASSSKI